MAFNLAINNKKALKTYAIVIEKKLAIYMFLAIKSK